MHTHKIGTREEWRKARIELANPGGRLVPGMFATIEFAPSHRGDAVLVPSEAVIRTGKRTVVIVAQGDGRFAPVDVEFAIRETKAHSNDSIAPRRRQ